MVISRRVAGITKSLMTNAALIAPASPPLIAFLVGCLLVAALYFQGVPGLVAALALLTVGYFALKLLLFRAGKYNGFWGIWIILSLFLLFTFVVYCLSPEFFRAMMGAMEGWTITLRDFMQGVTIAQKAILVSVLLIVSLMMVLLGKNGG